MAHGSAAMGGTNQNKDSHRNRWRQSNVGVTAQAVIHHYHRAETGITIINVKFLWAVSAFLLVRFGFGQSCGLSVIA